MKLLNEVNESVKILVEEKGSKRDYFIEGIFMQADTPNKNSRYYPRDILMREVKRYIKENIDENHALGELGHPEGPGINLDRVSHKIVSLREDGSNVYGKAKIMNTPCGNIVKNLIDEGIKLGVSSRGLGSLRKMGDINEVQEDFFLSTIDIVADPSAPEAYVEGVMEGKEWIYRDGIWIEGNCGRVESVQMTQLEEIAIKDFEKMFSKL
jgi:hypothetical protein